MLEMKPVTLSDKQEIDKYLQTYPYRASDGSFANLFLWQSLYQTMFSVEDGFLFISGGLCASLGFMCPLGQGDLAAALDKIRKYTLKCNVRPLLVGLTDDMVDRIESVFSDEFLYSEDRDEADYIYLSADLAELKGKKYHSKRNFVHRFFEEYYGRYAYEPMSSANVEDVLNYQRRWYDKHVRHEADEMLKEEICAIERMLSSFEALEARGGILKVDNNIIAYSMGTKAAEDTFVVQFEKADISITGAYQAINKLFASDCLDFKYINREDDMGKEGLRKSKLSYHPHELLMKYSAVWKKDENND